MTGTDPLRDLWVYLNTTPLFWLWATLVAYLIGHALHVRANRAPLVNPVAIAVGLIITLLWATGTSYDHYFEGAQFIHFLLGPATVALALPLFENLGRVRRMLVPMTAALIVGSVVAAGSAMILGSLMGASPEVVLSLAPKSVTSPIAMGISESIGGLPRLTAALVILTGILGAIIVTPLMDRLGIRDYQARGFAAGLAAHGIGTARAFQVHPVAGAFAGIGMGLNGLVTTVVVAVLVAVLT
ncbi:MAG: LrgB family protein [Rhodospirillum sp.]|nr:LrgB family protein [Rhodospirillum sp.]MCF8492158.1 LrgB family protein [Rhodospirillum sp.]MCF8499625.1 LrgB family protein [Rhodospirillum sp.]